MDVREPKGVNSGIVQGQILHRIKATSREGVALSPLDFVVGKPIEIFSRTYHVLGCDAFTRGFAAHLASSQCGQNWKTVSGRVRSPMDASGRDAHLP